MAKVGRILFAACARASSSHIRVSTSPGQTALTRTPRFDVAVLFVAGGKQKRAMARAWDEAVAAAAGDAAARLAEARKAYRV